MAASVSRRPPTGNQPMSRMPKSAAIRQKFTGSANNHKSFEAKKNITKPFSPVLSGTFRRPVVAAPKGFTCVSATLLSIYCELVFK